MSVLSNNSEFKCDAPGTHRDNAIDIAKGIGIILVCANHLNNPIVSFTAAFTMPLFFFISGMFFKQVLFGRLIKYKGKALIIPFIIYYPYAMAMKLIAALFAKDTLIEVLSIHSAKTIWFDVGPIWFLIALFYVLVIYNYLVRFPHLIRAIAILALFSIPYFFADHNPMYINSALLCLPFFYIGNVFKEKGLYNMLKKSKHLSIVAITGCIIIGIITFIYPSRNFVIANKLGVNPILFLIEGVAGYFIIIPLSILILKYDIRDILSNIGRMSLHIMALHIWIIPYLNAIYNYLSKIPYAYLSQPVNSIVINLFFLIVVIILSYYAGTFVKKHIFNRIQ
jgi:fucose 4-O-acetylase-like acetyltransferase